MKRIFSFILMLAILLTTAGAALVRAEETENKNITINLKESAFGGIDTYFSRMVESDGKIILIGTKIVEFDVLTGSHKEIARPALYGEPYISAIFPHEGGFIGFSEEDKQVYRLQIKDGKLRMGEATGKIKVREDAVVENFASMFVEDDVLYLPTVQYGETDERLFVGFNLKTGETRQYKDKSFSGAASYKDGKLFVYYSEPSKDYRTATLVMGLLDKSSGSFEEKHRITVTDAWTPIVLFYHKASDSLCYVQSGAVKRIHSQKEASVCAYVSSMQIQSVRELADGRVIFLQSGDETLLSARVLDENSVPKRVLRIVGEYARDAVRKAENKMSGTPVLMQENAWQNAQEMLEAISAKEESFDIARVSLSNYDMEALISKGYVAEIQNEAVKQLVESMHDVLKNAVMRDGKLYALPLDLHLQSNTYTPEYFEKFQLPVPKTYEELLDLEYEWHKNPSDEKNGYDFSKESDKLRSIFFLVHEYVKERMANNKEIDFDTPAFKSLLQKVQRNQKEIRLEEMNWDNEEAMEEFFEKPALLPHQKSINLRFFTYEETEDDNKEKLSIPLHLTIEKDAEPSLLLHTSVYIVNPKSKNLDLVEEYLKKYCASIAEEEKAGLIKGFDGEIINPDFEKEKAQELERVESVKRLISEAEGAEKATLEENYKYFLENYEKNIERRRVLVSKEAAKKYAQEMTKKLVISDSKFRLYTSQDVIGDDMYDRFSAGQVSIDQLVQELNNKVRLITAERQK